MKDTTRDLENKRERYLKRFNRENMPSDLVDENSARVGKQIVDLLKKEDMTHDGAYASLEYAYSLIKYESNFLKLG